MSSAKSWSSEAIEAAFAAQGIVLGSGRAERLCRAQQALFAASAADAMRDEIAFDAEPAGFGFAMRRCKSE